VDLFELATLFYLCVVNDLSLVFVASVMLPSVVVNGASYCDAVVVIY